MTRQSIAGKKSSGRAYPRNCDVRTCRRRRRGACARSRHPHCPAMRSVSSPRRQSLRSPRSSVSSPFDGSMRPMKPSVNPRRAQCGGGHRRPCIVAADDAHRLRAGPCARERAGCGQSIEQAMADAGDRGREAGQRAAGRGEDPAFGAGLSRNCRSPAATWRCADRRCSSHAASAPPGYRASGRRAPRRGREALEVVAVQHVRPERGERRAAARAPMAGLYASRAWKTGRSVGGLRSPCGQYTFARVKIMHLHAVDLAHLRRTGR